MLRRRVRVPVAPPVDAPAELRDPDSDVWASFDATRAWCEQFGLSNGPAGWSAMAAMDPAGRHQVAAEWWAILTGHFTIPGTTKVADWGYLSTCGVPYVRQRRLRARLDGIEIRSPNRMRAYEGTADTT